MRVIFFNGPPRSGKDTAAEFLNWGLRPRRAYHLKLSNRLKLATHGLYGMSGAVAPASRFEEIKDQPSPDFLGLTPRRAYIEVAERYLFPVHGRGILGTWLAEEVSFHEGAGDLCIVSDLGRDDDALPTIDGPLGGDLSRALIVRMERAECAWDNRVPVEISGVRLITVRNDGTVDELRAALRPVIEWARQD